MLILDLQAELDPQYIRLKSFYGQPFVFCLLHNFGGTLGLNGAIPIISQVSETKKKKKNTGKVKNGVPSSYESASLTLGISRIRRW